MWNWFELGHWRCCVDGDADLRGRNTGAVSGAHGDGEWRLDRTGVADVLRAALCLGCLGLVAVIETRTLDTDNWPVTVRGALHAAVVGLAVDVDVGWRTEHSHICIRRPEH